MKFTLVSTIFNEAKRLKQTIDDLEAQTIAPAEIIITDAGSNDGSWEILLEWQKESAVSIVLIQEARCNVARGRNLAIEKASNEIIVSTDFGCRFNPKWLEELTKPLEDSTVQVVGGAYTVDEENITTLASKANYILTKGYEVDVKEWFIPSSRSIAYRRNVWENVGKYPEWLTLAADDLVFGLKLKAYGYIWVIVEAKNVYWLRHVTAEQYGKESYRYGLGDGEAFVNQRNTVVILLEQFAKIASIISLLLIPEYPLFGLLLFMPSLMGFRSYKQILKNWLHFKSSKYNLKVFLYSIYLFEKNRYNYLIGYSKGYLSNKEQIQQGRAELTKLLTDN